MKYKLILFDADGTLFDFDKSEKVAFFETMISFGISKNLEDLHRKYEVINKAIWQDFQEKKITSSKLRVERFQRFFQQEKITLDPFMFSPSYLKTLSQKTELLPGAEEIVKYFHGKCEMALATNGLTDVQRPRFSNSTLVEYFPHIFISEEIGFPKPNKEYFNFIFKELPFKKSAIIVGDNLSSDIKGGNDIGIDTCWFNPQRISNQTNIFPTYEINNLIELKGIVEH